MHTADQGKYTCTCMSTRACVGTVRNIVYHIITINRGYPFTHTHSISVVGDLVYNKMAFIFTPVTPTTHSRTFNVMLLWFWNKWVCIRCLASRMSDGASPGVSPGPGAAPCRTVLGPE